MLEHVKWTIAGTVWSLFWYLGNFALVSQLLPPRGPEEGRQIRRANARTKSVSGGGNRSSQEDERDTKENNFRQRQREIKELCREIVEDYHYEG